MRTASLLLLSLPLFLGACSGGDPQALTTEGHALMNKNDPSAAIAKFDEALAQLDPSSLTYLSASVGRCEALASVDAQKSQAEFLKLANALAAKITDKDYKIVASRLVSAKQFSPAIDVMHAGLQKFPASTDMIAMKELIVAKSKEAKDPEALSKLSTLGYLGK